ncbi:MAG: menaquinol-cytochrome c reductase cytochrome b/c subunit [Nitriliruptoraceae bacterium]|jgi:menaquinol-cytochrome c reductase cytochrome b/c subunit
MSEEVQVDQATFDRLTAAGTSERVARAKAKAAFVRAAKVADGQTIGPIAGDSWSAAQASFKERFGASGGGGTAVAVAESGGRLTPEERAARVAASLGQNAEPASIGVPVAERQTHRMLALIPPSGIQQVQSKQADKVYTWPHLLIIEFVAVLASTALLLVVSFFIDATFRELANPNVTPNPSKAPWYFLGLQELLRYFHPMIAGVTFPGVGLILLGAAPYVDKNPSVKPENRKFAVMAMTWFLTMWTLFVFAGSFFRGPGFNWVWPWVDGLFFEL